MVRGKGENIGQKIPTKGAIYDNCNTRVKPHAADNQVHI